LSSEVTRKTWQRDQFTAVLYYTSERQRCHCPSRWGAQLVRWADTIGFEAIDGNFLKTLERYMDHRGEYLECACLEALIRGFNIFVSMDSVPK
jgi:hypothetical protein